MFGGFQVNFVFDIQVNNIAEELKLNLEKVGQANVNGDADSGDSNSAGSDGGDDKEDCDDKKPMITKEKESVKEKSLLGSLIGKRKEINTLFSFQR